MNHKDNKTDSPCLTRDELEDLVGETLEDMGLEELWEDQEVEL